MLADYLAWTRLLPVLIILSSLIPGLLIFATPEAASTRRTVLNLTGVSLKLALVVMMLIGVANGLEFHFALPFLPGAPLVLRGDALSLQFVSLSSVLWMATTIYAIGYLKGSALRSRFFGYFSLCVSATVGLALAGNMVTFLLFYELLTLATFPLVVHRGNPESLRAGRSYLAYTLSGGTLLLMGTALLHSLTHTPEFEPGGYLAPLLDENAFALRVAFVLMIIGLGVKAALIPLHRWLPQAMVAPAPVSALLHAVAVVKAGAFGIIRVVYDVFGISVSGELGLLQPLMWLAASTIIYGSLLALRQSDIKKRLAYSTVSQVSYITLGVAIGGPIAATGAIVHLVHQGVMKITLFFCAGAFTETVGIHKIQQMDGLGKRMPWTMVAFTIGALGMIGVPPVAGFISKWYLGLGALERDYPAMLGVLVLSSLLNVGYFFPMIYRGWFGKVPSTGWPADNFSEQRLETYWMLLLPPLLTAFLSVVFGLFAGSVFSPLGWSEFIVGQEFEP